MESDMSNVAVKWTGEGSRLFVGRDSLGNVLVTGSWSDDDPTWKEWKASKPSDLLLLGLASCTAYDVVMILERQRQALDGLYLEVEGLRSDDHPIAFTDIHITYRLTGQDLDPKKVERAVNLSQERYCSVANTIRNRTNLTFSFEIDSVEDAI